MTLDFEKLEYISSAGLRVLLWLRKQLFEVTLINVSPEVYDVLQMTGFTDLLEVKKRKREISIEGCPLLGSGANGKIYRLSEDLIVKVYRPGINLATIEAEHASAKEAFSLGVPCAISFDDVTCGDSFGTVFELISAKTLSEKIAENPDKVKDYAKETAELLYSLHQMKVEEGKIGEADHVLYEALDKISEDFTKEELAQIREIFDCVPKGDRFVHNDFHCKNIMVTEEGYMLVDLGDAGRGSPLLDLIHCRMCYNLIGSNVGANDPDKISFLGITYRQMREYWETFLPSYFKGDKEKAAHFDKKIEPFSKVMYYAVSMATPVLPKQYHPYLANTMREMLSHIDEIKSIDLDLE